MSSLYQNLMRPALFSFSSETAHEIGLNSLRVGLGSKFAQKIARKRFVSDDFVALERFGLKFPNPFGMAAGFDKNGVVVNQLAALGFGFVEVGTVTHKRQEGNSLPRLFRLPKDEALINRMGFNNDGTPHVVERLKKINAECVLGVNIGKNKDVPNEEATENYLASFDLAFEVADYIAVNVSSPNTPNLRALQSSDNLEDLLSALQRRNRELGGKPLLVKIAPDLDEEGIEVVVDVVLKHGISGIIATNTTISRDGLKTASPEIDEIGAGGLSGAPIRKRSNEVIRKLYKHSKGKCPIVGVGGVFTAEDAFEKIVSGASLIQAYTGFIYRGISFARDVNQGLLEILKDRGFNSIDDAIGVGVKGV